MTETHPVSPPFRYHLGEDVEVLTLPEARCGLSSFDRRDMFKWCWYWKAPTSCTTPPAATPSTSRRWCSPTA